MVEITQLLLAIALVIAVGVMAAIFVHMIYEEIQLVKEKREALKKK